MGLSYTTPHGQMMRCVLRLDHYVLHSLMVDHYVLHSLIDQAEDMWDTIKTGDAVVFSCGEDFKQRKAQVVCRACLSASSLGCTHSISPFN